MSSPLASVRPSAHVPDQVFVKAHRSGQAAVFDGLVQAVHALHLFRAVHHGRKADHAVADVLIEAGIRRPSHHIGAGRAAGEGLGDGLFHGPEGIAGDVRGLSIIGGMEDFHGQLVLFRQLFQDGQALLHPLVGNEAQVRAQRRLLRHDVEGVRAGLHGEGDRRADHGPSLGADHGQHLEQHRFKQPEVPKHQPQREGGVGRQGLKHGRNLPGHAPLEYRFGFHFMDEVRQAGDRGVGLGRTGMAAVGRGAQQHVRLALFKHADPI